MGADHRPRAPRFKTVAPYKFFSPAIVAAWVLFTCLFLQLSQAHARQVITVFAASSMKEAIEKIGSRFERDCKCKVRISFAGSGTLARQIAAGAPAQVFISADKDWMEWLAQRGAVDVSSIEILAANRLVVVASPALQSKLNSISDLASLRIAIGEPESVPAGRYAKAALQSAGLWEQMSRKTVRTENVRIALALVASGQVDAAILYASDLTLQPGLTNVLPIAAGTHPEILYPAAPINPAQPLATAFMQFLKSPASQAELEQSGFVLLKDDPQ